MDTNSFYKEYTLLTAFKKGDLITIRGNSAIKFYMVMSGQVDLRRNHERGEVLVETLSAGDDIGLLPFLAQRTYEYDAVAVTDVIVAEITEDNISAFTMFFPEKVLRILTTLSEKVAYANGLYMNKCGKRALQETQDHESGFEASCDEEDNDKPVELIPAYGELPPEHETYLFLKEVTCPVCNELFRVNHIRYSKLELEGTKDDFRRIYKDFDEMWYQIWKCPSCGYAHFHNAFMGINNRTRETLRKVGRPIETQGSLRIKQTLNDVLNDYLAFQRIIPYLDKSTFHEARFWQSLAWIYEDSGEMALVRQCRKKLRLKLLEAWFNATTPFEEDDEIKLAIKIAWLSALENKMDEAMKYYFKASQMKKANKVLRQRAQDQLLLLKEMLKEHDKKADDLLK